MPALSPACFLLPVIKPVLIEVTLSLILKLSCLKIPPAHKKTKKVCNNQSGWLCRYIRWMLKAKQCMKNFSFVVLGRPCCLCKSPEAHWWIYWSSFFQKHKLLSPRCGISYWTIASVEYEWAARPSTSSPLAWTLCKLISADHKMERFSQAGVSFTCTTSEININTAYIFQDRLQSPLTSLAKGLRLLSI